MPVMGDFERGEGLVALPRMGSFTGLPAAAGEVLPDSAGGVEEGGTRRPVLSPLLVREWNETGRMVALPCEEGRWLPSSSLLISKLFKLRRRYLFADSDVLDFVTVRSSLEVRIS